MDAEQFERAVIEHQRMVFSIALHAVRDRALAEEITQDVFLALLQHGDGIESAEHLVHWLRRVTSRKCIDQLRRQRWRRWLLLSEKDEPASACFGVQPTDPLLSSRLQRLVRALPAIARVALVLRYQEDLDPAEIGRLLGVTEKTVKKQLRRTLTDLKLRLNPPKAPEPRGPRTGSDTDDAAKPHRSFRSRVPADPKAAQANLEHR